MDKDKEREILLRNIPGLEIKEESETKLDGNTITEVLGVKEEGKEESRAFVSLESKESRKLLYEEVIERKSNGYYNMTVDFIKFLMKRNLYDKFIETITSEQRDWKQLELFRNMYFLWFEEKYKYNSRLLQLED